MIRLLRLVVFLFALEAVAQSDRARSVVGAPAGPPLTGARLEQVTDRAAARLRCPVCQGLAVNDSPATMAVNMKREVRDLVARGYSEQQVLDYFEHAYGQFVLLDPPKRGINWLVWAAPAVALIAGVFWIVRLSRRRPDQTEAQPTVESEPELEPYIRRVREIAFGTEREAR